MSDDHTTELPVGWSTTTLGQVSECILGGTPSTEVRQFWGGDVPWMASGDVHLRRITDVPGRITALGLHSSNATLTSPPAVAVGLAGQGKTRGTVALTLCTLGTNQSIALLKANGSDLRTDYLFHNLDRRYEELRGRSSGGGRGGLSKAILEALPIELPPIPEQQKAAQILDTLDTAIHDTEAIIAKLKVVKQGLLHDLLTRGIDADGELRSPQAEAPHLYKDSPLGWIPREWTVDTLRNAALPSRDSFIDGDWIETPFIASEGIRLIQTGNIGVGEFLDKLESRRFISQASFRILNCKWVKAGDILICRLADPIGRACFVPEYVGPAITSVDCTIFRVDTQSFSREFVLAWVNADASLKRAQDNAAGSTRSRISRSNLGMLPIAKPPLQEQQVIASALQSSAKRVADEGVELSKLRETKAGLLDDLLTGRVRVTSLLDEAEQQPGSA